MCAPRKRQQVMLAHRREGNVLDDDHVFVSRLTKLSEQMGAGVLLAASEHLFAGTGNTIGSTAQTFPIWVLANGIEQLSHGRLNARLVYGTVIRVEFLILIHRCHISFLPPPPRA